MNLWDEVLKEYDQLVHIPMSSGLSGSCQTAMMLAQDYDGKVEVVNNQRISVTQRESVLDAVKLAEHGMDAVQIREILEREKFESSIYLTLDTLRYLKKGGRITPAAAALGTLLRIKPVLTIQGENWMLCKGKKREAGKIYDDQCHYQRSGQPVSGSRGREELRACRCPYQESGGCVGIKGRTAGNCFPETRDILVADMPLSISCHVGPGILGIACMKSVDV